MTKEKSLNIAREVASSVDEAIGQEIRFAMSIAAGPVVLSAAKTGNFQEAQDEIAAIYKRVGEQYHTIFILNKQGTLVADSPFRWKIGQTYQDRLYFKQAQKGMAGVEGPLVTRNDRSLGHRIIVVYAPIMEESEFHGVVCLPFNMDYLLRIISRESRGKTGFAHIIDENGWVVAHPQKEGILRTSNINQNPSAEIQRLIRNRKSGTISCQLYDKEVVLGLSFLEQNNWAAVFTQDEKEIMAPMNRILRSIFFSGLLFLLASILIIIYFSEKVSAPIQKIMALRKQVREHSSELILEIGLDKKILYANRAYEKVCGVTAEQIVGMPARFDNTNQIPAEEIWKRLASGLSWSGRVTLDLSDDKAIEMDVMLLPLRDEFGTINGYLQLGRDVTAEKMYEKKLQQAQRLEAVGTMAGGIAHDFNNILSVIFGYAQLCLMKNRSEEVMKKNVKQILIASERARELVSQILTFSRNTDVDLHPLLPRIVLKEVMSLLRASIPSKIDIQWKFESESMIMAEPTQLQQIVMNLFMNGVYAIGKNSGTIFLALDDFFADAEFIKHHPNCKTGKMVRIRVSDTGSGMDTETLEKLFEPFFTTKPKGEGTGLGLSVVHGIVTAIGGSIWADSELGKGSIFTILIPCTEKRRSRLHQQNQLLERGTERIAFIDDEEQIASSMASVLGNLGYQVRAFTDSMEALNAIKATPDAFDLIITDYSMPQMTGLELTENLRENGVSIPVILTSGFFEPDTEDSARRIGIAELIPKPINIYQLTTTIQNLIKRPKE